MYNEPVTPAIARYLKKIGFDEPCPNVYDYTSESANFIANGYMSKNSDLIPSCCTIPTLGEALDWMNKVAYVWISVLYNHNKGTELFSYVISKKFQSSYSGTQFFGKPEDAYKAGFLHLIEENSAPIYPMKYFETNQRHLVAIKLPDDATDVMMGNHCLGFKSKSIKEKSDVNGFIHAISEMNLSRKYEFLGKAISLSDTQISKIIDSKIGAAGVMEYKDYVSPSKYYASQNNSYISFLADTGLLEGNWYFLLRRKID